MIIGNRFITHCLATAWNYDRPPKRYLWFEFRDLIPLPCPWSCDPFWVFARWFAFTTVCSILWLCDSNLWHVLSEMDVYFQFPAKQTNKQLPHPLWTLCSLNDSPIHLTTVEFTFWPPQKCQIRLVIWIPWLTTEFPDSIMVISKDYLYIKLYLW